MESQASIRTVVVELGRRIIRAGFAGEPSPRVTLPIESCGVNFAICKSLEDLQHACLELMSSIFIEHLHVKSKDATVLIVEPLVSSTKFREALVLALFQYLFVSKVSLQPDLFMPILSTGLYSGVVLDVGFAETRCVAVLQGRPLLDTIRVGKVGVRNGIEHLRKYMQKNPRMSSHFSADSLLCQVASFEVMRPL